MRSWCLLSDDDGDSWRQSASMLSGPERGLMEPYVIEISSRRLIMFMRTQMNCQYESISADGGETWSDARPGVLESPESPAALRRIPGTEQILAVWNHGVRGIHGKDRNPLNAALSTDGCESWHDEVLLEDEEDCAFSYPGVHTIEISGDVVVFITYYINQDGRISLIGRRVGEIDAVTR